MINEVLLGDNKDFIEKISNKSIDLILTDPPYNISKESNLNIIEPDNKLYNKFKNMSIDFGQWDKEELDWIYYFEQFYRVLKNGGTLIFFFDVWKLGYIKDIATEVGFIQPRVCQWVKTNPMPLNSKANYLSNSKE